MMIIRRWIDINNKSDILFRAPSEASTKKELANYDFWLLSFVINKPVRCTSDSHEFEKIAKVFTVCCLAGILIWISSLKLSSLYILCLWLYHSRDLKCIQRIFNGSLIKNKTCGRLFQFSYCCAATRDGKKYFSSTIWVRWGVGEDFLFGI